MRVSAQQLLNELLPVTLRFLADDWDDTSQTVHLFLSTVLGTVSCHIGLLELGNSQCVFSVQARKEELSPHPYDGREKTVPFISAGSNTAKDEMGSRCGRSRPRRGRQGGVRNYAKGVPSLFS